MLWDGKEFPLDELVIGGNAIWAMADIDNQTLELKVRVDHDAVSGLWTYGWGNNGRILGRKRD
jgi:hypothetical protein